MVRIHLSNHKRPEWPEIDLRSEDRERLILRVGLLEQDGKSIFCLVKNISPSGVQVRPYGNLSTAHDVSLRVGDERPIPGTLMWCRDGLAGLRFEQTLNPQGLLRIGQKMLADRRRNAPRMITNFKATLKSGGKKHPVIIFDLSAGGVRVQTQKPVVLSETTTLEIAGLPSLTACVRWSNGADIGLSLHPPLPIYVVSQLLSAFQFQTPRDSLANSPA